MNPLQLHIHKFNDRILQVLSIDDISSVSWQQLPLIIEINYNDFDGQEEKLLSDLSEHEKLRSFTYQKRTDALRFVTGRAFLRKIISRITGINAAEIVIGKGENQKPVLHYPQVPLNFNVSHAKNKVILAFDRHPIGIDIENSENALKTPLFGHKALSVTEQKTLITEGNYRENFCLLWTRKEAFLKAIGKGIDDDIVNIPSIEGRYKVWGLNTEQNSDWSVMSFHTEEGYICSLACNDEGNRTSEMTYLKVGPAFDWSVI